MEKETLKLEFYRNKYLIRLLTICSLYRLDPPLSQENYITFFNEGMDFVPNEINDNFG